MRVICLSTVSLFSAYNCVAQDIILDQILTWSLSVKYYSGEYEAHSRLLNYRDPNPEMVAKAQLEKIWLINYKMDGANRYLEGSAVRGGEVEFEGVMNLLEGNAKVYKRNFSRADINGDANLFISYANRITPEVLFGNGEWGVSLVDCYTNGSVEKYDLDSNTVVYSFRVPEDFTRAIDVYWDIPAGHIRQIDMVKRPTPDRLPQLLPQWDKKPFDLRSVNSTLEFYTVELMDGIAFPVHALKTHFKYNEDDYINIRERQGTNGNKDEFDLAFAKLPLHASITEEYILHSCELNVPIPKELFEFVIPGGTLIVDHSTGDYYDLSPIGTRPETTRAILIVAMGFLLLIAAGGGYAYYRKRKKKAA